MLRFFGALMAVILGSVALPAQAAVVLPSSVDLLMEEGEVTSQVWDVVNDSATTVQYRVELQGVTFGQLAEDIHFSSLTATESAWYTLTPQFFSLAPEATQKVQLEVKIPEGSAVRERVLAVMVSEESIAQQGIGLQEAVAALVFIQIGQDGDAQVRIDDYQAFQERPSRGPVRFVAALTNSGSSTTQPQIQIVIRDMLGRVVKTLNVNETGRRLPAKTTRSYSVDWDSPAIAFGMYRADLIVLPSDNAALIGQTTSVLLFTWQSGVILVAMLGAFGLLGWGARRYFKR